MLFISPGKRCFSDVEESSAWPVWQAPDGLPSQVAILLETGTAGPLGVLMRKITEGDPVLYWVYIYIYTYIYIYIGFAIFFGLGLKVLGWSNHLNTFSSGFSSGFTTFLGSRRAFFCQSFSLVNGASAAEVIAIKGYKGSIISPES